MWLLFRIRDLFKFIPIVTNWCEIIIHSSFASQFQSFEVHLSENHQQSQFRPPERSKINVSKNWRQITRCLACPLKGNAIHHHSPPSQQAHLHICDLWRGVLMFTPFFRTHSRRSFRCQFFPCGSLKKLRTSKLGGTVWTLAQNRLFFDWIACIKRSRILSMPVISHNIKESFSLEIEFSCKKVEWPKKRCLDYMGFTMKNSY